MSRQTDTDLIERAFNYFRKAPFATNENGCRLWTKSITTGGYGTVPVHIRMTNKDRRFAAHRLAWMIERGPIPDDMFVCHKCDEKLCCNVDHLFLGTEEDNRMDMYRKDRHPKGEQNGMSVLSNREAAEVKWLLAFSNMTLREIGKRYGISHKTVGAIKQGRTWLRVTPIKPSGRDAKAKGDE